MSFNLNECKCPQIDVCTDNFSPNGTDTTKTASSLAHLSTSSTHNLGFSRCSKTSRRRTLLNVEGLNGSVHASPRIRWKFGVFSFSLAVFNSSDEESMPTTKFANPLRKLVTKPSPQPTSRTKSLGSILRSNNVISALRLCLSHSRPLSVQILWLNPLSTN